MSRNGIDNSKPDPEHLLPSPAPILDVNDDALEKGLLLENPSEQKAITSPTSGLPNSAASALLLSTGPNEDIEPEDTSPAPIEPPNEIKPTRRDTRPLSPDQRTLLQSPLAKGDVLPEPVEKAVGKSTQDVQSDIPGNLDEYTAFWKAYNDDADAQDNEIVQSLSGDLDILLIFAGLFSALNVTFIIEAYKDLKQDNVDTTNDLLRTTNDLLRTLIHNQVSPSNPIIPEISQFTATPRAVRVNALFFTSLSCSLLTALGAVLGKQWLNHYKREGRRMTLAERGRERQIKYMGLERWHLEQVVETLPTLLQFSLFLFLAALIDFLWPINRTIAVVIAGFSIITFCFYMTTTIIAVFFPSAPFQTRFSAVFHTARISFPTWIQISGLVVSLRLRCRTYWLAFSSFFLLRTSRRSHTGASTRTPTHSHSTQSIQYTSTSDNQDADDEQTTSLRSVTIRTKISKMFSNIRRFLKRSSSSSPKGPVKNLDSILSKDGLSCECISWLLETSSVDRTLSLAATAALMLPERGWERIDTLDNIPHVLRLVLGARSFESKVILDAQPGTVKAVLGPLHELVMKWDRETELVVPIIGDNNSFVTALEHLLWRVVRTYPVEGTAAVQILEMLVKLGFSVEPHGHEVDLLYRSTIQVVTVQGGWNSVLGLVVLLESPLSFEAMIAILDLQWSLQSRMSALLQSFHGSIIMIDETKFIRTVHPSVRSFFADPARCQNPDIPTSTSRHTKLALNCVHLMTERLKRNILEIDNHLLFNKDIVDLEKKLTNVGVSESLQYACRHWATHLQFSSPRDPKLRDAMRQFCATALLPWLEFMSLLDCYNEAPSMILRAETWMRSGHSSNVTMTLLQDMHRFIMTFKGSIKSSAAAIYSVALPLTYPSELHTHYHEETTSLYVYPKGPFAFWACTSRVISPDVDRMISFAVSHDNGYSVSGSEKGTVNLFTTREGQCIAEFEGHKGWVLSVVFSPDSSTIVTGSDDQTIKIWDAGTHSLKFTLVGHRDEVNAVNVSPDSKYIVSGSDDKTVCLWNASTGSHIATMEGHSRLVWAVMFSPDGNKILSASFDATVRIWKTADRTLLAVLDHSSVVRSAVFSSDGTLIASGGDDNMLRIWDAESHSLIRTLEGHLSIINSLAFSPDSRFIASGSEDGTIWVWDVVDGSVQTLLEGHSNWINNISFTPDQRHIVSSSRDNTVRTWNWNNSSSSLIKNPVGHASRIAALAFSSNGEILASGGDNGEVHIWNVDDMAYVVRLDGLSKSVGSITFSSNGKHITAFSSGLTISWDLDTRQITSDLASSSHSHHSLAEHSIKREPGKLACNSVVEYQLALESGMLYVKRSSAGQEMRSKNLLKLPIPNISASGAHGYKLAVGTEGGRITILDFASILSFEAVIYDQEVSNNDIDR